MYQPSTNLKLCSRCFARFSGITDPSISLEERSRVTFENLMDRSGPISVDSVHSSSCSLCGGILDDLDRLYAALEPDLNRFEFQSFLLGARTTPEQDAIENDLGVILEVKVDKLSKEFKREFGKYLEKKTGKNVSFDDPDVIILFEFQHLSFKLQIKPIFVYGTYRKIARGIPQTRWIHRKDLDDSIETQIGECLTPLTGGLEFHLHGAGREDVDVLMLGNGREFIIESEKPRRRSFELKNLENCVNESSPTVRIENLRFASRKDVIKLKDTTYDKTYRATIISTSPIIRERLENAVLNLSGKDIYQRTPLRVTGSRSDLVRTRRIVSLKLDSVSGNEANITIRAQAGTYIKEMIHGDRGRTNPSLAELYGEEVQVKELDVIWIHRSDE